MELGCLMSYIWGVSFSQKNLGSSSKIDCVIKEKPFSHYLLQLILENYWQKRHHELMI